MNALTSDAPLFPVSSDKRCEATSSHGRTRALWHREIFLDSLIIIVIGVLITNVMWSPGLLWGHSAWFDLVRVVELNAAIRSGDLFPAWSPDLYHGYGSPLFQFYAPLSYYVVEIPLAVGIDLVSALKLALVALLIMSGLAMYGFARANTSRASALCAAILYMVAPYRMVDLFVRHALAEHGAFVWFPLIALGTQRFLQERTRGAAILAATATAGLVLTHNVMAMIALPVCVGIGWYVNGRANNWRTALWAAYPAAAGVGTTAFFWWTALTTRGLTRAEDSLTMGYLDFHDHFLAARRFFGFKWTLGNGLDDAGQMPLQVGLLHVLAIGCAIALLSKKSGMRWVRVGVACSLGGLVMCHAIAQPVWDALPLLKYVQFPWRFLAIVTFGAAMCGAAVAEVLAVRWPRAQSFIFVAAAGLVLTTYWPAYSTARFQVADRITERMVFATPEQAAALAGLGRLISFDGMITPEAVRSAEERATGRDDFLPRGVQEKPTAPAAQPVTCNGGTVVSWERRGLNRYQASASMGEDGTVFLQQFWFPGWSALVDGHAVAVMPFGKSAIASCAVPAGKHIVEFNYTGLRQRRAGVVISCTSLFAAVAMLRFVNVGTNRKPMAHRETFEQLLASNSVRRA